MNKLIFFLILFFIFCVAVFFYKFNYNYKVLTGILYIDRDSDLSQKMYDALNENNVKDIMIVTRETDKKTIDLLRDISQKLRDETESLKTQFDNKGIFSPETNALRASATYLLKLNKKIDCSNLEDAILMDIKVTLSKLFFDIFFFFNFIYFYHLEKTRKIGI